MKWCVDVNQNNIILFLFYSFRHMRDHVVFPRLHLQVVLL